MKLCIITGGPSAERGISLNSARSCYDHLDLSLYDLTVLYINPALDRYHISPDQLYSNTPLDFDYQLKQSGNVLSDFDRDILLQGQDYVLPIIHGTYGEDGQIQSLLESLGVAYLGSSSQACHLCADKYQIQQRLRSHGMHTMGFSQVIHKGHQLPSDLSDQKRVVKPLHGGSSLGVYIFSDIQALSRGIEGCFLYEDSCILEPYCDGQEFTILVIQNADGIPVALLPTQIVLHHDTLFDYRKKYLSTSDTTYYTPPQRNDSVVQLIRSQAVQVFQIFGIKDIVRLDGRLLSDGKIRRSDINRMSGMEQNSFLFQQTSLLGWTHRDTLHYLIHKNLPSRVDESHKILIPIVFGGSTAERQVSILSGTNVLMKLLYSSVYLPKPIFMDHQECLREIPFQLCLLHSVEEIQEKIGLYQDSSYMDRLLQYQQDICQQLGVGTYVNSFAQIFRPIQTDWKQIGLYSGKIFLGLHGGSGENGQIQFLLDNLSVSYNGPSTQVSRLCADKIATKQAIDKAQIPGVRTAKYFGYTLALLSQQTHIDLLRNNIVHHIGLGPYIIKPADDGCSAGVLMFTDRDQLENIIYYYLNRDVDRIPADVIYPGHGVIMLPTSVVDRILIEEYIVTDQVILDNLTIQRKSVSDWIEVTIGVIGRFGEMQVLDPSQTIASGSILSMEEKFMGGIGINLTPPPSEFICSKVLEIVKERIKKVIEVLGITGYSRIDTFIYRHSGECIVIEINTLPALTPSTVLFHQGLKHQPPLRPLDLIEYLIRVM